jgi:hypothetical protein
MFAKSVPGQSRHFNRAPLTSGLPRLADILRVIRCVSKVPIPDVKTAPLERPLCTSHIDHAGR